MVIVLEYYLNYNLQLLIKAGVLLQGEMKFCD
jgi:hypothetical protein